jgi:hypothetical protein
LYYTSEEKSVVENPSEQLKGMNRILKILNQACDDRNVEALQLGAWELLSKIQTFEVELLSEGRRMSGAPSLLRWEADRLGSEAHAEETDWNHVSIQMAFIESAVRQVNEGGPLGQPRIRSARFNRPNPSRG